MTDGFLSCRSLEREKYLPMGIENDYNLESTHSDIYITLAYFIESRFFFVNAFKVYK